ncbi:hypothetical protein HKCCE3408_11600 [Rhodobacterales bacterium HKCCE3408]|nr:hypothetical protein [Rhodobacterales bacterium HKCCE3408]
MRYLILALALMAGPAAAGGLVTTYGGGSACPNLHIPDRFVPHGYRSAWTDGRLNPRRGPCTEVGDAMMGAVWTDTVPMRAENPSTRGAALRGAGPAYVVAGRFATPAEAEAAGGIVGASGTARMGHGYAVLIGPYANMDLARDGLETAYAAGLRDARITRIAN